MMMNRQQIETTAELVASVRPDWDHAGVAAALRKVAERGTPIQIAIAALRAAEVTSNRTPAVIALNGPHWAAIGSASYGAPMTTRCRTCGWHHHPDEGHYRRSQRQELAF